LSLLDLFRPDLSTPDRPDAVYLVYEYMASDLSKIIVSSQTLDDEQIQWIMYQLCCGLAEFHSFGLIHRDIKPGNILVDGECGLKICDYGLSRFDLSALKCQDEYSEQMTEQVVSRWYRAPEIFLCAGKYSSSLDMWSVGCVFAGKIIYLCITLMFVLLILFDIDFSQK
jgi:mitogen-activated protein kinase 1/3